MAISVRDRKNLHDRAGGQCSFLDCAERLSLEEAHVRGRQLGSARYDPTFSQSKGDSYENLILLCATHHAVVDDKDTRGEWPTERILQMKVDHEQRIARGPALERLDVLSSFFASGKEIEAKIVRDSDDSPGTWQVWVDEWWASVMRTAAEKLAATDVTMLQFATVYAFDVVYTSPVGEAKHKVLMSLHYHLERIELAIKRT